MGRQRVEVALDRAGALQGSDGADDRCSSGCNRLSEARASSTLSQAQIHLATRYDQLADSFLGMLYLATARYWIKFVRAA
jgi:hypothetical protein